MGDKDGDEEDNRSDGERDHYANQNNEAFQVAQDKQRRTGGPIN